MAIYNSIQDTYIDSTNPDSLNGSDDDLYAIPNRATFIRFEKINNLENSIITSAILHFRNALFDSSTMTFNIHLVNDTWNEFLTTFNTAPSFEFLGTRQVTVGAESAGQIDITSILPNVENLNERGIVITGSGVRIDSRESTDANAVTPYLDVTLEALPPEPPEAPTILLPLTGDVIDRAEPLTVEWSVTNQDSFELQTSTDGSTWSTVSGTTARSYTYTADTFSTGSLYIRLRIEFDSLNSDYTPNQIIVVANKPPAPTSITSGTVSSALPEINWTATNLKTFDINIIDSSTTLVESGTGTTSNYQIVNTLSDNETYTIEISYTDTNGLTSPVGTSTITTSFISPTKPIISLTDNGTNVSILINNVDSTAIYNDVFKLVDGEWVRIKKDLVLNDMFMDSKVKSGVQYQYKVRAFSPGLGYIESDAKSITITFENSLLTTNTQEIELKWEPSISKSQRVDRSLLKFAGRQELVAEYGIGTDVNFSSLSFRVRSKSEVEKIEEMIGSRFPILYRNSRGEMVNLSIQGVSSNYITSHSRDYIVSFVGVTGISLNEVV